MTTPAKYAVNGRPVTVTGSYDGHGEEDPPGIYYVFDDTPSQTRFMSQTSVPVRMIKMEKSK